MGCGGADQFWLALGHQVHKKDGSALALVDVGFKNAFPSFDSTVWCHLEENVVFHHPTI